MNQFADEWFELQFILGPRQAIERARDVDNRENIDWKYLEQITHGAFVTAGCAILGKAGLKNSNIHTKLIFELRNAFIHNDFDISKNRNKKAYLDAVNYLKHKEYKKSPLKLENSFFDLNVTKVVFKGEIHRAIQMCLL